MELIAVWVVVWLLIGVVWAIRRISMWLAEWQPTEGTTSAPVATENRQPTKAERMTEARLKYEQTLAMLEASGLDPLELSAAKLKAKQDYLRDIDKVMR